MTLASWRGAGGGRLPLSHESAAPAPGQSRSPAAGAATGAGPGPGLRRAPLSDAVALVQGRWVLAVLDRVEDGPKRYREIKAGIPGISEKVLTETLRRMERDGLLERRLGPEPRPHLAYLGTPRARALDPALRQLARWHQRHWAGVEQSRRLSAGRQESL